MNEMIIFYKSISRTGSSPCEVEEEMFGADDADVISVDVLLQEVTNSGIKNMSIIFSICNSFIYILL